jgi:hypothetical protein
MVAWEDWETEREEGEKAWEAVVTALGSGLVVVAVGSGVVVATAVGSGWAAQAVVGSGWAKAVAGWAKAVAGWAKAVAGWAARAAEGSDSATVSDWGSEMAAMGLAALVAAGFGRARHR